MCVAHCAKSLVKQAYKIKEFESELLRSIVEASHDFILQAKGIVDLNKSGYGVI